VVQRWRKLRERRLGLTTPNRDSEVRMLCVNVASEWRIFPPRMHTLERR